MIETKKDKVDESSLACVLIKKYYLDGREEEKTFEQLTNEDLIALKLTITALLDLEEPLSLLRSKAEIICNIHDKLKTWGEIVTLSKTLVLTDPSAVDEKTIKGKEISIYMFGLLATNTSNEDEEQMKASFVPLLPDIMTSLLDDAKRDCNSQIEEEKKENDAPV